MILFLSTDGNVLEDDLQDIMYCISYETKGDAGYTVCLYIVFDRLMVPVVEGLLTEGSDEIIILGEDPPPQSALRIVLMKRLNCTTRCKLFSLHNPSRNSSQLMAPFPSTSIFFKKCEASERFLKRPLSTKSSMTKSILSPSW